MSVDLVDKAVELLCDNYIFPAKAQAAAAGIRRRRAAGEYDGLDEAALGERLTAELFEVCKDKHLRVRVREEGMRAALTEPELEAAWREQLRLTNYGIARVERLDGNVGLVDLRSVTSADVGGRAIAAAMELVSQTHALIVDLRKNRGGAPDGAIFWTSYFFPDGETHLNSVYIGATGHTRQYWSHSWLPGERYLDRPVYLLTSGTTFSGGEEICYNLKAQGRAVLIGETTRGGAHPTQPFPITPTFEITVPVARSVNPVTDGNWEGVGVEPDVPVPATEALDVAYRQALQHVLATSISPTVLAEARSALS
ncbi:interphotoreceptor retinoid-binding protein [Actinoplanes lobatus]|uniref:C-terminal processing protease CtpA/Prc n=1 Tax=Actinoplanes lobatus TaxID=113568 RepID=A0A7W7HJH0_9ACTN|nr:S41 family peptidase [Actinoplanes lobatus]MBB4751678.1 C-terminal processing protease CtpA/Prc [Actinoplanes lobatus]GGN65253.1 interphotoreceptor retinoid-binding protein [Actinoplanes lobatus]GIE43261.1 interphotoreceptor retinoid-binding protein [Actinoplanes lobatus]